MPKVSARILGAFHVAVQDRRRRHDFLNNEHVVIATIRLRARVRVPLALAINLRSLQGSHLP